MAFRWQRSGRNSGRLAGIYLPTLLYSLYLISILAVSAQPARAVSASLRYPDKSANRADEIARPIPVVTYSLAIDAGRPRHFKVHITAPRTAARSVEFAIPAWAPGYYQILHFENGIDRVRSQDENGRTLSISHPSARIWSVATSEASGRTISLDYDVAGSDKGLGFFGSMLGNPRRIGYVNGASAFMYVQGLANVPVSLSVQLPEGWKCAAPLDSIGPSSFSADTYDDLIDSPLQLGSFDSFSFQVAATPFRCIIVGNRQANAAKVTRALACIAREAIGVFGSIPFRQYFFIFHIGEMGFTGGLEHRNSTVIHLDDPIANGDDDEFVTTCAHELFHAWNVKRIRPEGLGPFDYSQIVRTPSLWFAEGVTDYYADLLPVRAGLRTPEWFMEQMVQHIHQLDTNPARSRVTLEQASNRAWEGQSEGFGGLSYYLKGGLMGCYFDLRIRMASHGERCLDDVLRELDRSYGARGIPYPPSALLDTLSRATGRDESSLYRKYVSGTDDIRWDDVLPGAGFVLTRQEDGYLGISFSPQKPEDETDDREDGDRPAVVERVEAGCPAAKMDLKPGDQLMEIDGRQVNYGLAGAVVRSLPAGVPVKMLVKRHGRILQLQGSAGTQYSHHALHLRPDAAQIPEIERTLHGLFASRANALKPSLQAQQ